MAIDPASPQGESGEAHPYLEGDSCLLRQNRHRARLLGGGKQPVKRGDHLWFATDEVVIQPNVAAEVRLIPIGEAPSAVRTDP